MTARLVAAVVLVMAAMAVAAILRRRRSAAAPEQLSFTAPTQLDRHDFADPDAPWLVAVFTSATCGSCADTVRKARVLACNEVTVDDVEVTARRPLHDRYNVQAVPITCVADATGLVRAAFVGPVTATDLWAAVAEARAPGSSPEPDLGRDA